MKLFTIYDHKAGFARIIFAMRSRGEALREFAQGANDPKSYLGQNPEDYTLYEVGHFDDLKNEVTALTATALGKGTDYVNRVHKIEGRQEGVINE